MLVPGRLVGAMLALVLCGCQATVTLKSPQAGATPADTQPDSAAAAPDSAPAAAPAIASTAAATEEPSPTPDVATPPAIASPPALAGAATSATPVVANPPGLPATSTASAQARGTTTLTERFQSGLHTGTVGAAFGSLGGPIGLAAGGGAGFVAGFVAGRPLFGSGAPAGRQGNWERQVENQQTWEEQVAARVEEIDGPMPPPAAGIGDGVAPASSKSSAGGEVRDGADPMQEHQAWEDQITAHAPPVSAPSATDGSLSEPGDSEPAGESEIAGESP